MRGPLTLIPFGFTAALYFAGAFCPGIACWGFDFYGWFPQAFLLTSLAIAVPLFVIGTIPKGAKYVEASLTHASSMTTRRGQLLLGAALSAALLFLFMSLRSQSLLYGDGYIVLHESTRSLFAPFNSVHDYLKPLTIIAYRAGHALFSEPLGFDPQTTFSLISSLSGVATFWGLFAMARLILPNPVSRSLLLLGALTSSCTILFFGYVEHYPFITASLMWLLVSAVFVMKSGRGVLWVVIISALTIASDAMLTPLVILVSVFLLGRRLTRHSQEQLFPYRLKAWHFNAAIVLSSLVTVLVVRALNLPFLIVPLAPEPNNPYAALTAEHIRDLANLAMSVAPVGVGSLIVWSFIRERRSRRFDPIATFLISVSILLFTISFWLDPLLSAARDWDLLSFVGFPLSVTGLYLLLRDPSGRTGTANLLLPAFTTMLVALAPNIAEKGNLGLSTARLDGILWQDLHYSVEYDRGYRNDSWGYLLFERAARPDLAIKCYRRLIEARPNEDDYLYTLGKVYMKNRQYDSAAFFLREALRLRPRNGTYMATLSQAERLSGNTVVAEQLAERVSMMKGSTAEAECAIGVTLAGGQKYAEALEHFRSAYEFAGTYEQAANMAITFGHLGQDDSALVYFLEAEELAPPGKQADFCRAVFQTQLSLSQYDAARLTLRRYRSLAPEAADLAAFEQELERRARR